jgi:chemotaxis signal transduction protein
MAKTAIHEQTQALSVYFRDMLAEPDKTQPAEQPVAVPDTTEALSPTGTATQPAADEPSASFNGKQNFLLCEIGGLTLAIAVSSLNNIVHWPQHGLTRIPGQSAMHLGLLSTQQQQCDVLDIRYLLQAPDTSAELQPDYILLLDKGRRGIACNRIEHIKTFASNAINWRQDRSQRPWFLGVLNESMHSIVDLTAIIAACDNGEMA